NAPDVSHSGRVAPRTPRGSGPAFRPRDLFVMRTNSPPVVTTVGISSPGSSWKKGRPRQKGRVLGHGTSFPKSPHGRTGLPGPLYSSFVPDGFVGLEDTAVRSEDHE